VNPVASLEPTFLIDLLPDQAAAIRLAKTLVASGEPRCVTAPAFLAATPRLIRREKMLP
jgi:hypothetical protein